MNANHARRPDLESYQGTPSRPIPTVNTFHGVKESRCSGLFVRSAGGRAHGYYS